MKETLETKDLREALTKCGVAVARRSTLVPINGNLVVESYENVVRVKSTDLESYVVTTIKHSVSEPFSYCLPYKPLVQFLGKGNDRTTLSYNSGKILAIERPLGMVNLWMGTEVKDYPPEPTYNVEWHVLPKEFCRMLGILLMGCAKDESRPVLTAVCVSDGKMASADGFRLYAYENKDFIFGLGTREALIPATVVNKVIRLFGKEEKVEVGFDKEKEFVAFRSGDTTLVGRLGVGTYPRYQQLIPETFQCKASFSVPLMMERLSLMPKISNGIMRFVFTRNGANEELCIVSAKKEEFAEYELSLPVKIETTKDYGRIAINPLYVRDAIKAFSVCSMELTSPASPAKFTGDIDGLSVTVMPMFVQW